MPPLDYRTASALSEDRLRRARMIPRPAIRTTPIKRVLTTFTGLTSRAWEMWRSLVMSALVVHRQRFIDEEGSEQIS